MYEWILCTLFSVCAAIEPIEIRPKGNIYSKNDRPMLCGLRKIEKAEDTNDYICIYDHPHSKIDDRVTIGYGNQCPKRIYCDKR